MSEKSAPLSAVRAVIGWEGLMRGVVIVLHRLTRGGGFFWGRDCDGWIGFFWRLGRRGERTRRDWVGDWIGLD